MFSLAARPSSLSDKMLTLGEHFVNFFLLFLAARIILSTEIQFPIMQTQLRAHTSELRPHHNKNCGEAGEDQCEA